MFERKFYELLKNNPEAAKEKRRLSGLLRDIFPGQQMQINLLMIAFDLGITKELDSTRVIDNAFAFRFVKRMMEEYGVSRIRADWAISIWCVCYGQQLLRKSCDVKVSTAASGDGLAIKEERGVESGKQYAQLFSYGRVNDGYGITGFVGKNKRTLIFPNRHNAMPVTRIMKNAFSECEVQEVVMTEGIDLIEESAFKGCFALKQVIFSETLKEIGASAFEGCANLATAALPPAIERIGKYAFAGTNLKSASIPCTVYWTDAGVYSNCKKLSSIQITQTLTVIADRMFQGCELLTDIKLPETVSSIGARAFEGCVSMKNIVIPESVKVIGEDAFANVSPKFTMLCYKGSAAEQYARENKITFQIIY